MSLSNPFVAMNCYSSRVIQCNNGNTILLNYKKIGCDFLLYDNSRKIIKRGSLTGRMATAGESNKSAITNIFETDTTLAIFLYQVIDGRKTMYRILMSPVSGNIIDEKKIAEIEKPKAGSGWIIFSVYSEVSVVNDPESGNYAVISYDGFTPDLKTQLRIDLYDAQHQKLWNHDYQRLVPAHKYLEFSALIINADQAFVCTHEWTTRSYGKEESIVVLSKIMPDGTLARQQKLDVQPALKDVNVRLLHAPVSKRIMMCLTNRDGVFKQNYEKYKTNIVAIDEDDFSIAYNKELMLGALDEYSRKNCPRRKGFGGSFCDWMLDKNGNPRILLSELQTRNTSEQSMHNSMLSLSSSAIESADIGIIQLDRDGNHVTGYVVAHADDFSTAITPSIMNNRQVVPAYIGQTAKPLYEHLSGSEFSGYNYIYTPDCDYLIYNVDRKEITKSICNGIYSIHGNRSPAAIYTIKDGVQSRDYLFQPPAANDLFRSTVIASSSYSSKTKTLAVVMTEQHKSKMVSYMAWVQF